MAKKLVSLRLDKERLGFVMEKSGWKSEQKSIEWLIGLYWDAYHLVENPFKSEDVPKNEVTQVKKHEDKPIEDIKDDGIVTQIRNGRPVKGRFDENGLFKRL